MQCILEAIILAIHLKMVFVNVAFLVKKSLLKYASDASICSYQFLKRFQ